MKNQIQTKKKIFCKQNIPNMLVILRMVFAFFIVALIICDSYGVPSPTMYRMLDLFVKDPEGNYETYCSISLLMLLGGILFVLACITDWLDGKLARKYNWVSDFGKFWDPIADKVLVNSVMIGFAWHGLISPVFPIIMIARDIIVDADRMVAAKDNIVVAANIYGKMKTVVQMLGLILIFFIFQCSDFVYHAALYWGIQHLLIYCATIVSVMSGVIYMKDIAKAKKAKKQDANKN